MPMRGINRPQYHDSFFSRLMSRFSLRTVVLCAVLLSLSLYVAAGGTSCQHPMPAACDLYASRPAAVLHLLLHLLLLKMY